MESKVIVDSCVDFNDQALSTQVSFERIPFKLRVENEELIDRDLNTQMLLDKMKASKNKVSTACPSPEEYRTAIDPNKVNYIITISSKLSGSYNSAMIAASIVQEDHPDCQIYVIDSESAAAGQDLLCIRLLEYLEAGLAPADIADRLHRLVAEMHTYFILNSLENLAKNGRISNTVAIIGKMLKIVPIMSDDGHGEIALKEKVRGKKKSFARLVEIISDEVTDASERILAITHVHARETAEKLKTALEASCTFKDIVIFESGGLSTLYADNGGIVLAY